MLHKVVQDRLGADRIHTGHHLVHLNQQDRSVESDFIDRTTNTAIAHVESDLLVGCDGIHSVVRRTFYREEGPPRWNGVTMWRGVTVGKPLSPERASTMVGPLGRRVLVFPISKKHEDRGEALINWVAFAKTAADQPMPRQDWDYTARVEEALAPFTSFVFDFLDVPALMRATETIYQYPMVDREPLPTWNFGRVTLLGDAAHPCTHWAATEPPRRLWMQECWLASWRYSQRLRRRWQPMTEHGVRPLPPSC
ncbi:MAG: hypothetical protein HC802_16720 [Caldilineaceae bacterium]|nr:hypothetical protein [Caldilineaceae bacterium]